MLLSKIRTIDRPIVGTPHNKKCHAHRHQKIRRVCFCCKTQSPIYIFQHSSYNVFMKESTVKNLQNPHFPRRATRNCRLRRRVARRGSTVAQDRCSSASSKLHPPPAPQLRCSQRKVLPHLQPILFIQLRYLTVNFFSVVCTEQSAC